MTVNVLRYLRDTLASLSVVAVTLVLTWVILRVSGSNEAVSILIVALGACCVLTVFAIEYGRRREFNRDLNSYTESPGRALWSMEIVNRPEYLEGQIAYDALRQVSKAANDGVAETNRQMQEYREYIETWVHEAKSPLAAAHLMIENMDAELSRAQGGGPDPAVLNARLDGLADALDRMEGYIEQALFYARSETVDRDYLIRPHSLRDLISQALRDNARAMIDARMQPRLENLDLTVFADEKWLRFIVSQVIQNSVKYARSEGAEISFVGRLVGEGTADERIEFTVADNGCGVPAADVPRVFDKGFTGDVGRTGRRSTGIGLYLVKRLCDKMGVGIRASSVAGEGFTVHFSFPTNKFHYFEG